MKYTYCRNCNKIIEQVDSDTIEIYQARKMEK